MTKRVFPTLLTFAAVFLLITNILNLWVALHYHLKGKEGRAERRWYEGVEGFERDGGQ